jgi:hypothetical protein
MAKEYMWKTSGRSVVMFNKVLMQGLLYWTAVECIISVSQNKLRMNVASKSI